MAERKMTGGQVSAMRYDAIQAFEPPGFVDAIKAGDPSQNIEDRGYADMYGENGQFSKDWLAVSNSNVKAQQRDRRNFSLRQAKEHIEVMNAISAKQAKGEPLTSQDIQQYNDAAEAYNMIRDTAGEQYRQKNTSETMFDMPGKSFFQTAPLSIEEPQSDKGKIDISMAEPRATLPPNRLKQRAGKAAIATQEDPVKLETEMADQAGEAEIRQRAILMDQDEFRAAKNQYLDELLKNRDPDQPMTLQEANFITGLSQNDFTPNDPQAMEKLYARRVTNQLYGSSQIAQKAMAKDPSGYNDIQDAVEQWTQKSEGALRFVEDQRRNYDANTGVVGHIWNIGEQFIPFKSMLSKYDMEMSSWLPGQNMTEQVKNLWLLPPEQFLAKFKEGYDQIAAHNPLDAQEWADSVLSFSRMSEGITNFNFGLDVASSLPFGLIFKGAKATKVASEGGKLVSDADRLKQGWKVVSEGEGTRVPTDDELRAKGWSIVDEDGKPIVETDAEKLKKGWKIVEPERPSEWINEFGLWHKKATVDDYKTDQERLAEGWDVGEVDYPEEFRAAVAAEQTAKALTSKEELKAEEVLAKTGHQEDAVDLSVKKQAAEDAKPAPDMRDPSEYQNLSNRLNSMYNPRNWMDAGSRLTREATERIMNIVDASRAGLKEAVTQPGQAMRLTEQALALAAENAKPRMRDEFRFANSAVIDSRWRVIPQENNPETQVNELVMTLGTPEGYAFRGSSPEDAQAYANNVARFQYGLRPGDYRLEPVGDEFYIQVKRPLDERDVSVAKAMIQTENETPKSLWNTFLGWWRNPDDLLSKFSRENRKAVTGAGQALQHYFTQTAKTIDKLSDKQRERLGRIMVANRDDPDGLGGRGRWFDNASEYENRYYQMFQQWPTEAETAAYMITRELSDFDWSVKSLTILRDKARQGIINVHTKLLRTVKKENTDGLDEARWADDGGPAGPDEIEHQQLEDVAFEGKLLASLPESKAGDQNPSLYIVRDGKGQWQSLEDVDRKAVQKMIDDEGYKVYQVGDPLNNPFGEKDANFVLLKNAQTSELRAEDMLPYRAGYHVEYAPGWYTKQGKLYRDGKGRLTYGGDTSVLYHVSEAAAKKYTQAFEKARSLLKAGDTEALKAHLSQTLPHSYEQFVRMFSDGTLDINTPVLYTKSGRNTRDASRAGQGHSELYDSARDAYNSPYNMQTSVNRQFAQEKDLALPSAQQGSESEPLNKFVQAKMIDPLSSLSRNMHRMVKQRVYDNYQYQSVTSFVEEFANPETIGGSVTKRDLDQVRNNPLAFIADPMWNEKADRAKLAAAKNAHRAITNLLGVQSDLNRNIDYVLNKVIDTIFEKRGDQAATKAADFLATNIKDPARYARYIAFHAKLGLGNPVQLFLQMQSVVHGAAITGNLKRSYQAMGAGMLMRYLSLATDDAIVKSFAQKARVFGWKPEEFLESFENMKAAGIWHVEGEVADLNDIMAGSMFKSKAGQWLNKGTFFFQEGERFVRLNAWNTAYKEWRTANPTKVLGNRERNQILRRYDDLAINMTRSSTGAWQQGLLSIPAQFSTYQVHLMEQLLGKRLTLAEKARVLATYSALYGVPTGAAAMTAVWPWGADIQQAAMERGIETNNGMMDTLLHGIMATGFEWVTGREYSFGERYGPNGLMVFKEALTGKKGVMDLFFGPSGQIASDILLSMDPVARDIVSIFQPGGFQMTMEDFGTAFRNVSTVNNAYQMFYAMNAGKFMSRNGLFTTKADTADAIMKGIFGLDPRRVTDTYIQIESMTEFREAQKEAQKEFLRYYRRGLDAMTQGDKASYQLNMTYAKSWLEMGGFRPDQYEQLLREAFDRDTSLTDKIYQQWPKRGPAEDINMRFEQQQRNR